MIDRIMPMWATLFIRRVHRSTNDDYSMYGFLENCQFDDREYVYLRDWSPGFTVRIRPHGNKFFAYDGVYLIEKEMHPVRDTVIHFTSLVFVG